MKVDFEALKSLVEAGDKSAFEKHVFEALEKGDVQSAVKTNKDVMSEVDSIKDTHHKTALETWKTNNLETLINDEVAKRNPQETPEQKRIRELEEKIASGEKAQQRAELKAKALAHATKQGLPSAFASKYIDRFLGDDESVTTATLDELKSDLDGIIKEQVDAKFKGSGRDIDKPGGGSSGGSVDVAKIAQEANIRNK